MLPKQAIKEFNELYRKKFGIELNDAEANRKANKLINLYKAIYDKPSFDKNKNKKAGYDTTTMS